MDHEVEILYLPLDSLLFPKIPSTTRKQHPTTLNNTLLGNVNSGENVIYIFHLHKMKKMRKKSSLEVWIQAYMKLTSRKKEILQKLMRIAPTIIIVFKIPLNKVKQRNHKKLEP